MKRTLLVLLCLAFIPELAAQLPGWRWAAHGVNYGTAQVEAVAFSPEGEVYSAGSFSNVFTIGDSLLFAGNGTDLYVSKYDLTGRLIWLRHVPGEGDMNWSAMTVDAQTGDLYLTASVRGSIQFDATVVSSDGHTDVLLVKYTAAGELIWVKRFGPSADRFVSAMHFIGNGQLLIGGEFATAAGGGRVAFGAQELSGKGGSNIYFLKADTGGNVTWLKGLGSYDGGGLKSVSIDAAGNLYAFGNMRYSIDIDSFTLDWISSGWVSNNFFIIKLDTVGRLSWARAIGGIGPQSGGKGGSQPGILDGISGTVDRNGIVTVCGSFSNTRVIFAKNESAGVSVGTTWLARYDSSGNILMKTGATAGIPILNSDAAGNVYLFGATEGAATIGPLSTPGSGVYVAKLNSQGIIQWINPTSFDVWVVRSNAAALLREDELVVGGQFAGMDYMALGKWVCYSSNVAGNGFLGRFGAPLPLSLKAANQLDIQISPNPARVALYLVQPAAGTYQRYALYNALGQRTTEGQLCQDQRQSIQLPALAPGTYHLEVSGSGGAVRRPVIIQP